MKRAFLAAALAGALCAQAAAAITLIPRGAVQVRSGAGAWAWVSGPVELAAGQEVHTAAGAAAEISFPDGSKVALAPGSQFRVDTADRKETLFTLSAGKLRAAFAGLFSSRIAIRTPTAVCAVRGTVFEMGADARSTEVNMAEGVLEVQDNKGRQAVVTSEETVTIGEQGMEQPRQVSLSDNRALPAVRPMVVDRESARDATRRMLEDVRNRELKANEAQLGKDVIDAFGHRVRLEEYLLRPTNNSFELLFLSHRQDRFDWGHLIETFNSRIPDDMSQVPAIISSTFLSKTRPANWLTSMEFYATNTIDAEKEVITLGNPVQVDFSGYNDAGAVDLRWYPSSIDFVQTLYGPGVPGGSREQFNQHQDWNTTYANRFTWTQSVPDQAAPHDLAEMIRVTLDPTDATEVADGGILISGGPGDVNYDNTNTVDSYPNGADKTDFLRVTTYPDGSTLGVEKFLVSNDGKILGSAATPDSDSFIKYGNFNLEINIKSSLFQGRDIDVLIAPEILQQKKTETTTVSNLEL